MGIEALRGEDSDIGDGAIGEQNMQNFTFHNPTRIVFGKDRLNELADFVPQDARVLLLYGGGSVKRFGTLDKVKAALGDRPTFEFGGIEPNPRFATLSKAVDMVRANDVNFLLAVGGGSVMDGTKFVALGVGYDGNLEDLLQGGFAQKNIKEAVPMGCVVTLPATGSEMNSGAVVSHNKAKYVVMSPLTYPQFSFLDPELTFTLPTRQVANGVVDAFVHVLEQYVTFPSEARFQDRTAEGILQTLIEVGPKTVANPTDYDARANLVWCATNALNGLIGAGVPQDWTTHMIGHELTAMFGLDHAQTLAVIQPAVWRVRKDKKHDKLLQYARRVWGISEAEADDQAAIDLAIKKTQAFFESLGVRTRMRDYGIKEDAIDALVSALEANGMTALSESGDLTLDISRQILQEAA